MDHRHRPSCVCIRLNCGRQGPGIEQRLRGRKWTVRCWASQDESGNTTFVCLGLESARRNLLDHIPSCCCRSIVTSKSSSEWCFRDTDFRHIFDKLLPSNETNLARAGSDRKWRFSRSRATSNSWQASHSSITICFTNFRDKRTKLCPSKFSDLSLNFLQYALSLGKNQSAPLSFQALPCFQKEI
jgi:hypothetical protein